MYFNNRNRYTSNRISNGITVVSKSTRIDHNPIKFLIRFMNPVDNYTFVIRLYALNFYPMVSACSLKLLFKILKIICPIYRWFAYA